MKNIIALIAFLMVSNVTFAQLSLTGACYGTTPNATSLNPTNQITLYAKVKVTSEAQQIFIHKWKDGEQYSLEINEKKATFVIHSGTSLVVIRSENTFKLNEWVEVIGTYDGASMRIYEGIIGDNMQMTGVKNFSGPINTGAGPLTIGRRSNLNSEYMVGEIARVFIDDVSLTDESINNGDLPSSSDLVLDYNNFASIPTLTDVSGNNNNGTTACTIKSIESLVDGSELQLSFNRAPMRQIGQSFKTMQKGHLKEVVLKIGDQGNLQGGELRVDLYQLDVNSSTKYSYWTFIESSNTIGYKKGIENIVNFSGNSRIKANNYYILVVRSANFFPLAGSNQNPFKEGDAFYIDEQSMTSKAKIERTELKVDNTFDLYFRAVLK